MNVSLQASSVLYNSKFCHRQSGSGIMKSSAPILFCALLCILYGSPAVQGLRCYHCFYVQSEITVWGYPACETGCMLEDNLIVNCSTFIKFPSIFSIDELKNTSSSANATQDPLLHELSPNQEVVWGCGKIVARGLLIDGTDQKFTGVIRTCVPTLKRVYQNVWNTVAPKGNWSLGEDEWSQIVTKVVAEFSEDATVKGYYCKGDECNNAVALEIDMAFLIVASFVMIL